MGGWIDEGEGGTSHAVLSHGHTLILVEMDVLCSTLQRHTIERGSLVSC